MEKLRQPIELYFTEPKSPPKGLADTLKLLKEIEAHVAKLSTGPSISPKFNQSIEEINKAFLKRKEGMRPYEFGSLAKSLGLDDREINQVKAQLQKLDKATRSGVGMTGKNMTFSDLGGAAKAFRIAMDRSIADTEKNFSRMFTGGSGGSAKAGGIKVDGKIDLLIPAAQFNASVIGSIPINIPASQFTAGGGRDPVTGQFLPGGGGGGNASDKTSDKKKGGGVSGVPKGLPSGSADEISRTITQTEKNSKIAIEKMLDGGKSLTTTFNETGDEIKRVTKDPKLRNIGKQLSNDLANLKRQAQADILNVKTGDKGRDLLAVAKIKDKLADDIRKSFAAEQGNLPAPARDTLKKVYTTQANVVAGQAREAQRLAGEHAKQMADAAAAEAKRQSDRAAKLAAAQARQAAAQKKTQDAADLRTRKDNIGSAGPLADAGVIAAKREVIGLQKFEAAQKMAMAHEERAKIYQQLANETSFSATKRAGYLKQAEASISTAAKLRATPPPASMPGFMKRTGLEERANPMDFLKNTIKVGAWGAAVAAAAAPVTLMAYSLSRMIEVGSQTARLEQVFSKVGGSARMLTDDVLALAAANGRSSDEALESAVAWSRLGLSRVQINEAVRVSLMAANVAEMTSAESTKHLSALMAAYSLNVSELDAVLGMLNNTSNKFNVTNSDLLTGLSRTAAVAKQAGIPLAELQGMIGAAVGRTGQTGANIGNAIKSVIVSMSTPDVQDFLQERFKLSTTGEEIGQMKSMSQVMRELYVTYMGLNDEERKSLTVRVAGKTQASRFVAILESYNQAQKLAADSQLHLNSAEQENARILATQKAQLAGVRTEWDRLVTRASVGGSALPAGVAGLGVGALAGRLATGAAFGGRFGPIGAGIGAGLGLMSGGSANEQLTDLEHLLRNVLRIGNLGGQINNRSPLRIEKIMDARLRGEKPDVGDFYDKPFVQRAGMQLVEAFRHPIRSLNAGLDYSLGDRQGAFEKAARAMLDKQITSESASAGYGTEARRLQTLAEVLGRPGTRGEELKSLFEKEDGRVAKLVEENKLIEAQAELRKLASAQDKESLLAKASSVEYQQQVIKLLNDEIALNDRKINQSGTDKEESQSLKDRNLNLRGMLNDAKKVQRQMLTEQEDIASGDPDGRRQNIKTMFSAAARQMEGFKALSGLQKPLLMSDQLEEDNAVLLRQIEILKALEMQLEKAGRPMDAVKVADQRREVAANLPNESDRELARTLDRRSLYTRRAEGDVQNMAIGTDPAERLLNQKKGIEAELERLKKRQSDWSLSAAQHEADNARALVLQNQLLNTRENIQKRIRDLAAEEKQARLEGQREFNRSLMTSGPGDLLRKFAASQLNAKGQMTTGQFFAMSPQMRGDVDMMNGGDAVRRIREERARLRGITPQTPEEEAKARASGMDFRSNLSPNVNGSFPDALNTVKLNAELNRMSAAANGTALAMESASVRINAAVDKLVVDMGSLFGGGFGLNTGHSLGASN